MEFPEEPFIKEFFLDTDKNTIYDWCWDKKFIQCYYGDDNTLSIAIKNGFLDIAEKSLLEIFSPGRFHVKFVKPKEGKFYAT